MSTGNYASFFAPPDAPWKIGSTQCWCTPHDIVDPFLPPRQVHLTSYPPRAMDGEREVVYSLANDCRLPEYTRNGQQTHKFSVYFPPTWQNALQTHSEHLDLSNWIGRRTSAPFALPSSLFKEILEEVDNLPPSYARNCLAYFQLRIKGQVHHPVPTLHGIQGYIAYSHGPCNELVSISAICQAQANSAPSSSSSSTISGGALQLVLVSSLQVGLPICGLKVVDGAESSALIVITQQYISLYVASHDKTHAFTWRLTQQLVLPGSWTLADVTLHGRSLWILSAAGHMCQWNLERGPPLLGSCPSSPTLGGEGQAAAAGLRPEQLWMLTRAGGLGCWDQRTMCEGEGGYTSERKSRGYRLMGHPLQGMTVQAGAALMTDPHQPHCLWSLFQVDQAAALDIRMLSRPLLSYTFPMVPYHSLAAFPTEKRAVRTPLSAARIHCWDHYSYSSSSSSAAGAGAGAAALNFVLMEPPTTLPLNAHVDRLPAYCIPRTVSPSQDGAPQQVPLYCALPSAQLSSSPHAAYQHIMIGSCSLPEFSQFLTLSEWGDVYLQQWREGKVPPLPRDRPSACGHYNAIFAKQMNASERDSQMRKAHQFWMPGDGSRQWKHSHLKLAAYLKQTVIQRLKPKHGHGKEKKRRSQEKRAKTVPPMRGPRLLAGLSLPTYTPTEVPPREPSNLPNRGEGSSHALHTSTLEQEQEQEQEHRDSSVIRVEQPSSAPTLENLSSPQKRDRPLKSKDSKAKGKTRRRGF
jgi:hypothetical protein